MQLIRYDAACKALAECKAIDEVKDWRDKAQALQAYAKQAKNKTLEIDAAEIRIRAERRLGVMLDENGPKPGGDRQSIVARADNAPTLDDLGISRDLSARAQQIASIPEEAFEATLAEHRDEQQAVTGRTMEKLAKKAHVSNNSGNNEWYTPPQYIESARRVMGSIDFDPASSPIAQEWIKASAYLTEEDNGLEHKWAGNVWMNPPYSQPLISQFSEAFLRKYTDEFHQAIVLVNNATDAVWMQNLLCQCDGVCFPRGRIRFLDREKNPKGAPLQGQAFIYYGSNAGEFDAEFSQYGVCF